MRDSKTALLVFSLCSLVTLGQPATGNAQLRYASNSQIAQVPVPPGEPDFLKPETSVPLVPPVVDAPAGAVEFKTVPPDPAPPVRVIQELPPAPGIVPPETTGQVNPPVIEMPPAVELPPGVHPPVSGDVTAPEFFDGQPVILDPSAAPPMMTYAAAPQVGQYPPMHYNKYPFWFSVEYVLWRTSSSRTIPLATSAPIGTPAGDAGVLDDAETFNLFGGQLMDRTSNGVKYTAGAFIDNEFSLFAHWTQIKTSGRVFAANENTSEILARPFTSTVDGEDSRLIAYPGLTRGSLGIRSSSSFFSPEILLQEKFVGISSGWLNFLYGYRHMSMDEDLAFLESTRSLSGVSTGTTIDLSDVFLAKNRFHGGTFGLQYDWDSGNRLQFSVLGKLSYGSTRARVSAGGLTTTTDTTGAVTQRVGGLLTQPTNIGSLKTHSTTPILEFGATLRYQLKDNLHATLGYTILNWRDIARVGDQLDSVVNPTQITGTLTGVSRPILPSIVTTDYTAQALRLGLEFTF